MLTYVVSSHYFLHGLFLDSENWILENADKLCSVPGVIIQGRYDMTCPPAAAWGLHKVIEVGKCKTLLWI